ncbi:MAG TPA: alpha/beta hydrolase [Candidatus Xenobia bacterium]|jgi:pimeloyl-ACP methyl ester carboxylesterase
MTITHNQVDIGDMKLHLASAGQGPPILFLHGFPEFWKASQRQLEGLSDRFKVMAVDLPGYNESDKPAGLEPYRLPNLADVIRRLVGALGAQPVTLVGHDWGGAVAWTVAALFPTLLERLVIINMPHPILFRRQLMVNPAQQQASAYMSALVQPNAEAMLSADNFKLLGANIFPALKPDEIEAYRASWAVPGALTGALAYYRAVGGSRDAAFEAQMMQPIRVPTLVIWGERDRALLPANLEGLPDLVPGVEIHRLAEATHWVMHEQPDVVNRLIKEFMTKERVV